MHFTQLPSMSHRFLVGAIQLFGRLQDIKLTRMSQRASADLHPLVRWAHERQDEGAHFCWDEIQVASACDDPVRSLDHPQIVSIIETNSRRPRIETGDFVRIVIFGAAGATGRALVTQALTQGHQVTAFVRTPAKFELKHAGLNMVQGDVADAAAVERALFGQDAVLCALGAATPLKRDKTLLNGMDNIVRAVKRSGPPRLIYLSFLGVSGGREQLSLLGRHVVAPLILRNVVTDHEAKENIITRSGLDWTIVRPPRLTNGPHTGA